MEARGRSLFDAVSDMDAWKETHDAFSTFQKDADQIYPDWKEKLSYTSESTGQAASSDWTRQDFEYHTVLGSASWWYRETAFAVVGEILEELSTGVAGGGVFGHRDGRTPGAVSSRRGEDARKARTPGQCGNTGMSDGASEFAMSHGEIKGAFLTFQKDVDQIYPGRKEKLTNTGEFPVQAASSDRAQQASAAAFVGASVAPVKKDRGRSLFLSQGVIELDRTHEEFKGAFVTFQKAADQIYPGQKEKLDYTDAFPVQVAIFDCDKQASAATFVDASVTPARKKDSVASQALDQSSRYADLSLDETISIRNGKHVPVARIVGGCGMMYPSLTLATTAGDPHALFDRGRAGDLSEMITQLADVDVLEPGGFSTASHAYKESQDKGGINETINDKLAEDSIYEEVDKSMKVGAGIRDMILDPLLLLTQLADVGVPAPGGFSTTSHVYKEFLDKGGTNELIDDKLADDSVYEDVANLTKIGTEHSGDKVSINEFIKDQPAGDSIHEDVDKFMKVGKEIRGKIMDNTSQENFEDTGGINEFIKDQPADLPIYEEGDKFTQVGKEIRDKIMDNPFPENFETATAAHFAAEPSAGTNVKGLTTDAFTTSLEALVYYIDPDSEEMMIAYPNLLFDRNIFDSHGTMSSFLARAVGNNQGMGDVQCGKIYDLYMPPEFLRLYDAPVVNLEDMWRIMGKGTLNGGLGAGATIKPKLGLQPKPLGEACCAFWPVGDFITNDELLGRQVFCQMNECIPEVVTDTRVTIKETGNGKLFLLNNAIGLHPETFLTYDAMDAYTKASVHTCMRGHPSPQESYTNQLNDCIPEAVQAMRAAIRETGNGKLFSANTTADDPNEMITHGNHHLSQFGSLLENCALLAYPNLLFDQFDHNIFDGHGMLPPFPTWTIGTYQGTGETEYGKIYDLYMPPAFLRLYDGPAVNVEDMRHILGKGTQNGGLREGASIKLKPGLQPKPFGGGCYAFWPVGDFVMNDEQQGHPVFCQCIPEVVEDIGAATRETGHGTPLSTNIPADDPNEMTARGKYCLFQSQSGPFMVDGYVAGGIAETCACRNFSQQFLHYRRAGHGSVTSTQTRCDYTAFVHTTICRVIGASGIHTGTMSFDKMEGDASDKNIASMLQGAEGAGPYHRQEWEGTQQTTPAIPGGMNALHLPSFCGQGPSDHPDLAKWLMDQGIDSLSLNPYGSVSLNPDSVISALHLVT